MCATSAHVARECINAECEPDEPATGGDDGHLLGRRVRRYQPLLLQVVGEAERRRMDSAAGLEHEHDPGLDAKCVGHLCNRNLGAEQRCDGGWATDIGDCRVRRERHINAAVVATAINAPAAVADVRVARGEPDEPATCGDDGHLLGRRVRRCQPLLLQVVGEAERRRMDSAAGLEHEHDPGLDAKCVGHLCNRNLGAEQRCDGGWATDIGDCRVRRERHINAAVVATAINAPAVIATAVADVRVARGEPDEPATCGDDGHLLGRRVRRCQPLLLQVVGEAERRRMDSAAGLEHEHDPGLDAKCVGHLCNRNLGAEQRCDGGLATDIGDCGVRRERHITSAVIATTVNAPASLPPPADIRVDSVWTGRARNPLGRHSPSRPARQAVPAPTPTSGG